MENLSHKSIEELEYIAKSHKNIMRLMLVVFISCKLGLGLTFVMIINDYQLLWVVPYILVLVGQWWLINGGRWSAHRWKV